MTSFRKIKVPALVAGLIAVSLTLAGCDNQKNADKKDTQEKVIQVAVSPSSPPMLFQKDNHIVGADLDLFKEFAKKYGYKYKLTSYDWQGMLGAVASGKADMAFSGISITPKREKVMEFSHPYFINSWYLVSTQKKDIHITNLDQLKKYSIGYPRGMAYSGLIKNKLEPKHYYSLKDVKLYPSYNETVSDLMNGNLDLAFIELPVYNDYKFKRHFPIEIAYSFNGIDKLGFAFKKGSPIRAKFNAFIESKQGKEDVKQTLDKWLKG
ncbi:transporter substrate-binding domain-containing protein [Vibrio sp. S4M6]|uniref:transporter substrate-binding domain-containing protein n=1 Tax=Vibrio sinus TaxID=2946865 RepID=UPI00202AAF15|nr:transporter substrate-binding domain-containing protein [Vibrio sinus]MCL9781994.1 transporter substrate-binding domain-containing protein [Vibrio sinus]